HHNIWILAHHAATSFGQSAPRYRRCPTRKLTFAVCYACQNHLSNPSLAILSRSDFIKHSNHFINAFGGIFRFLLTSGTALERIGDESASSGISRFVHHQIL
ncbi:MAG: hypothetical protein KI789_09360, partial [Hoeflea sp.]|nr:hypothetical protein [Hoeflea sp.]